MIAGKWFPYGRYIAELFFQSDRSNHMETMLKRLSFPNCSWGNIPLDPTEHEKIIKSWLIQCGEKGMGEPGRIESGRRAGSGREKGGKWERKGWEVGQVGGNYAVTLILCLKKG